MVTPTEDIDSEKLSMNPSGEQNVSFALKPSETMMINELQTNNDNHNNNNHHHHNIHNNMHGKNLHYLKSPSSSLSQQPDKNYERGNNLLTGNDYINSENLSNVYPKSYYNSSSSSSSSPYVGIIQNDPKLQAMYSNPTNSFYTSYPVPNEYSYQSYEKKINHFPQETSGTSKIMTSNPNIKSNNNILPDGFSNSTFKKL